jgi:hypothetical protein
MTVEEFKNQVWNKSLKAMYEGDIYDVTAVNFKEQLLELIAEDEYEDYQWVRCENIKLV